MTDKLHALQNHIYTALLCVHAWGRIVTRYFDCWQASPSSVEDYVPQRVNSIAQTHCYNLAFTSEQHVFLSTFS